MQPWQILIFILFGISLLHYFSCTTDSVAEPETCMERITYDETTRNIIRAKCTDSGCHDGASGVGNYNTYNGMKSTFDNGEFRRQVITEKLMPKGFDLSSEDFELLKCWTDNGFPEN